MEKKTKENDYSLTQLEIQLLKEQRKKIMAMAALAAVGALDLALLKVLSNTVGTDDQTVSDLIFLLLGGGSCFLGSVLMGVNAIDYMDMKKEIYSTVKIKAKTQSERRNTL